jgi:hypothetical protein
MPPHPVRSGTAASQRSVLGLLVVRAAARAEALGLGLTRLVS